MRGLFKVFVTPSRSQLKQKIYKEWLSFGNNYD